MLNDHKKVGIKITTQYVHLCPQFFQGITIVMNIINLDGGSAEPPEPPHGYGPEIMRRENINFNSAIASV